MNFEFSDEWLDSAIEPRIRLWRAYRPMKTFEIVESVRARLEEIRLAYETYIAKVRGTQFDDLTYEQVSSLPELGYAIKPYNSAMFPSKFSHWIAPEIYPIMDGKVLGLKSGTPYENYWRMYQRLWREQSSIEIRNRLIGILVESIVANSRMPLFEDFPWAVKITELCLMGS